MSGKMRHKSSVKQELLEVVDERNRVIGQLTRGEIHQRRLRHRAAHILIFNDQGELFLQKRSMNKDEFPGVWDSSAAGHVEIGESYDHCILREVKEELGIQLPAPPERLLLLDAMPVTGMEFCQIYRAIHNGPFILNRDEIETGRWFTPAELVNWQESDARNLTSTVKIILNRLSIV